MDLPDPYLPGAISLLEQLDKKLLVVLRDGRTLIGYLRYSSAIVLDKILLTACLYLFLAGSHQ